MIRIEMYDTEMYDTEMYDTEMYDIDVWYHNTEIYDIQKNLWYGISGPNFDI